MTRTARPVRLRSPCARAFPFPHTTSRSSEAPHFPRSPTTRSCLTATPGRWWRPTGASNGCACLALTRRACSGRCWIAAWGWIVVRDGLAIGPWHDQHADETSHTRPPTDHDADHMLIRTVQCIQGEVQVEAVCEPIFDYGRTPARWERLRLVSDLRIGIEGNRARARHTLVEGERRFVALGWMNGATGPADCDDAF